MMIQTSNGKTKRLAHINTIASALFIAEHLTLEDEATGKQTMRPDELTITYTTGHSETIVGEDAREAWKDLQAARTRQPNPKRKEKKTPPPAAPADAAAPPAE